MKNENLKNYGIILMVLAGVILIGVLSYWSYSTWKIIDWAAIVVCGYIGYKIYNDNK